MSRSPKTPKFTAFNNFDNCFGELQQHKGSWFDYLGGEGELIIELGCGRGEFALQYAKLNKTKRLLAIDLKADRMYAGAKQALEAKLKNLAFLQANARNLAEHVGNNQVSEIWLTFPDPYPKDRQIKHRMSGGEFLKIYHEILTKAGTLHLKTDNKKLFAWSMSQIKTSKYFKLEYFTRDLHSEEGLEIAKLLTAYEKRFLAEGLKTNYLVASPSDN